MSNLLRWLSAIWTVFAKEAVENTRDRRSLVSALVLGPLLGPILFAGIASMTGLKDHELAEAALELPVIGAERAPNFIAFLKSEGVKVQPPPEDPEVALRDPHAQAILRIGADYAEDWKAGRPARVDVLFDGSRQSSSRVVRRVHRLLETYSNRVGAQRLLIQGLSPDLIQPLAVVEKDYSTARSRAALLLSMLPYFLIMSTFFGGLYLAIDATTGERERQSLEPLLCQPVPRAAIMCGKLAATSFYAALSATCAVIAFTVVVRRIPFDAIGMDLVIAPQSALMLALLLLPVSLLTASAQTVVASFAKTLREAQTYLQFLTLGAVVPSLWIALNPVAPQAWMWWTPLLSQNLLFDAVVRGDSLVAAQVLASSLGTLAAAALFAGFAMQLYRRESLAVSP